MISSLISLLIFNCVASYAKASYADTNADSQGLNTREAAYEDKSLMEDCSGDSCGGGSSGDFSSGPKLLQSLVGTWSLQLPISGTSSAGEMLTIDPAKIGSFSHPGIFEVTPSAIVMTVDIDQVKKNGPGKSPNSHYYRTELRQGTNSYPGFSLGSSHLSTLVITFSVDQLVNAPQGVVVAQIHGAGPLPNMELKIQPDGFITPEDHKNAQGTHVGNNPPLITNYKLGTKATIKIVAGNGQIQFYYNGALNNAVTIKGSYSGQYWKTGTYCQATNPGTICKVSFYSIDFTA